MARNVMKHIVHNWGSNILSIHDGIGPQFVIQTKNIARGTTDPEIDSVTWIELGNNMAPLT